MASILPKIFPISRKVIRILGCNPGPMTLQGTNTYVIGTGKKRVLLDAGESNKPEYIELLKTTLREENCELQSIIISHWHHDHIGGIDDIMRELKPVCALLKLQRSDSNEKEGNFTYLKDGDTITTEGATLKVVATPGHTTDHLSLILEEEKALFSGDCILGEGTTVFEDLYTYMQSLKLLLKYELTAIYPGHGPVISDPIKKIQEYINHRQMRENQIIQCLKSSMPQGQSVEELVTSMYADVPVHLHPAAAVNVSHHISKLLKENIISEIKEELQEKRYILK